MNRAFLLVAAVMGLISWGCARDPGAMAAKPSLPERIADEFAAASPLAAPNDSTARDAAAVRLTGCREFRVAAGEKVIWGGFDPAKGYDPKAYLLTEFDPLVWLKLYASTFMFTGEREVRQDGPYTLLELKAKFRSQLDPGDYPYPFWHNAKKWQGYVNLASVVFVFQGDKIVAVYRMSKADPEKSVAERPWDGQWHWTDAEGRAQPRVSLFSYLFAADNPYRASVDEAYRNFEGKFRAQNCQNCHGPDNQGKSKELFLMVYPNQSLIGRHRLVKILKENKMPPEDAEKHHPAGIEDRATRSELIGLAQAFVRQADAAVAFESSRKVAALGP